MRLKLKQFLMLLQSSLTGKSVDTYAEVKEEVRKPHSSFEPYWKLLQSIVTSIEKRRSISFPEIEVELKRAEEEHLNASQEEPASSARQFIEEEKLGSEEGEDEEEQQSDDFGIVPANNIHGSKEAQIAYQKEDDLQQINVVMNRDSQTQMSSYLKSLQQIGGGSGVSVQQSQDGNLIYNHARINNNLQKEEEEGKTVQDDQMESENEQQYSQREGVRAMQGGFALSEALFQRTTEDIKKDLDEKKDQMAYQKLGVKVQIQEAHAADITGVCHLNFNSFATCSLDQTLKVWKNYEKQPLGILEEEGAITNLIRIKKKSDEIVLAYVCETSICKLSLKQQKAVTLHRETQPITTLVQMKCNKQILVYGCENG